MFDHQVKLIEIFPERIERTFIPQSSEPRYSDLKYLCSIIHLLHCIYDEECNKPEFETIDRKNRLLV